MNLTVTCTNLPPHLCFLSAELVNSLPQISGMKSLFFDLLNWLIIQVIFSRSRAKSQSSGKHWTSLTCQTPFLKWMYSLDTLRPSRASLEHGKFKDPKESVVLQTRLRMCLSVILLNLAALKYLLLLFCYFLYFMYGFFCRHILTLFLSKFTK